MHEIQLTLEVLFAMTNVGTDFLRCCDMAHHAGSDKLPLMHKLQPRWLWQSGS